MRLPNTRRRKFSNLGLKYLKNEFGYRFSVSEEVFQNLLINNIFKFEKN